MFNFPSRFKTLKQLLYVVSVESMYTWCHKKSWKLATVKQERCHYALYLTLQNAD